MLLPFSFQVRWAFDQLALFARGRTSSQAKKSPVGTPRRTSRREAERGGFDPLYLVYALGRSEIESLRAEVMRAEGAEFDLARFHARLLGLGAPPLPLARAYMLRESIAPPRWLD